MIISAKFWLGQILKAGKKIIFIAFFYPFCKMIFVFHHFREEVKWR